MSLSLLSKFPVTLQYDGSELKLLIDRMNDVQYADFIREFNRINRVTNRKAAAMAAWLADHPPVPPPGAGPDWQEPPDSALARYELSLSPEQLATLDASNETEDRASSEFIAKIITSHVRPAPDANLYLDGELIKDGAGLLRAFGASRSFMQGVLQEVFLQNTLTDAQKKQLKSLSASTTTPAEPVPAPTGDLLVPTVSGA